ncbi:alkaline phosphatase family protein [Parasedimentitalea huanghaiensis]|uniref:Alkaline phosphatase family protein n=1 Tax=Parasedimentitalea huanghaiensis TaxID=2682100 RepID=A0A6L6WN52_9RHOB|nr:alkaline phosphatase family protein [Zongyanglinia huanghaiensis]MVO17052.1 alkaline phosphatase family protein [Zongyanglinia huanghaiensis]
MLQQSLKFYSALIAAGLAMATAGIAQTTSSSPRLVLQITVDQLRADLIARYSQGYGDSGFNYLLRNGVVFKNAHHRHANTETIVGHATLATGADPAIHGMVANLWYDRKAGRQFYNVQDEEFPLLGARGVDQDGEIDPTQRAATTDGRSPRAILTTTVSDEIADFFGPEAKVFGVSVKDRGAISMAGHAGTAYWFSKSEGRFVTSTYYRDTYPDWVGAWQDKGLIESYTGTQWTLSQPVETYRFAELDDQPWETDLPGWGTVFPHEYGPADNPYFTTFLTLSPAGDALTVDFAKTLIDVEQVGTDEVTDYLSISLSSTDYVGHIFGPSSLESEDNLKQLDGQLADLLSYVDARVGLRNTLVILSADHGGAENPGYLETLGIEAQMFSFDSLDTTPGAQRLKDAFGVGRELIQNFSAPYVYLDQALIAERGLDADEVERAVAQELQQLPGIAFAVSSSALRRGQVADTSISNSVLRNFHPDRSGDIYVVFEPHWFIGDLDGLSVAAAHGSPWSYDSHVPLIFAGPGIQAKTVVRRVETVDIAPTITTYLGTKLPSGVSGVPLVEVFE